MHEAADLGEPTCKWREKAGVTGQYEWPFVSPVATLCGSDKKVVGKYCTGPTWEAAG